MIYKFNSPGMVKENNSVISTEMLNTILKRLSVFTLVILTLFIISLCFDVVPWSNSHFRIYSDSLASQTFNAQHDAVHQQKYEACFRGYVQQYNIENPLEKTPTVLWIEGACNKEANIRTMSKISQDIKNTSSFTQYYDFIKALVAYGIKS